MKLRNVMAPLAALLLASCGASSSTTPAQSSAPESQPQPGSASSATTPSSTPTGQNSSAAPSGDAIKVTFWHTFGQKNGEALKKTAGDFAALVKANMGVDVTIDLQYLGAYGDIYSNITDKLAIGDQPTMAIAYPDHVASYIAAEGNNPGKFVVNLDNFMNDREIGLGTQAWLGDIGEHGEVYDEDDIIETYIDEGRHFIRQGTYTFPFMKSSEVLFYNLEAVERAFKGWKPEITSAARVQEYMNTISWDEFMNLCEYISANKSTVLNTIKTPLFYDSDGNFFISKMFQNGIPYSSINSENNLGQIDFESGDARTKAEAMVKTLKQQFDRQTFRTKGTEKTYGSDSFKSGESVFTVGSTGGTGYNMPSGDSFTVGVCPVPASNNNPLYVTQGPSLTFFNSNKLTEAQNTATLRMAWMFAKYLTNPDTNVYQCTYGSEGYSPVRYSALETENYQEFISDPDDIFAKTGRLLADVIGDSYFNTAVFPGSAELRDQAGGILTKVFAKDGADDAFITTAFNEAINTAKTKFR
ncbi:MAG: hypothetical protein IJ787_04760 [Bacilli bacterium]|nr:hypothetical protein [Bacilli bacterium]